MFKAHYGITGKFPMTNLHRLRDKGDYWCEKAIFYLTPVDFVTLNISLCHLRSLKIIRNEGYTITAGFKWVGGVMPPSSPRRLLRLDPHAFSFGTSPVEKS